MNSEITQQPRISLPQAGARLGMTWGQTYNALLRGKLQGSNGVAVGTWISARWKSLNGNGAPNLKRP